MERATPSLKIYVPTFVMFYYKNPQPPEKLPPATSRAQAYRTLLKKMFEKEFYSLDDFLAKDDPECKCYGEFPFYGDTPMDVFFQTNADRMIDRDTCIDVILEYCTTDEHWNEFIKDGLSRARSNLDVVYIYVDEYVL